MEIFGYAFADEGLLREALTTPAYKMDCPTARDNQRLEFLGDSLLGFLSAERVYAEYPHEEEGALTVRRTHMVSTAALCAAAARLGLDGHLIRNRGAAKLSPHAKIYADAIEAIVGAAFLDGGLSAARQVFDALNLDANAEAGDWCANPKGELQMRAQAMKPRRRPVYTLLKTEGKAHDPWFTVRVEVDGVGEAVDSARTHKEAESKAAARLLARLNADA